VIRELLAELGIRSYHGPYGRHAGGVEPALEELIVTGSTSPDAPSWIGPWDRLERGRASGHAIAVPTGPLGANHRPVGAAGLAPIGAIGRGGSLEPRRACADGHPLDRGCCSGYSSAIVSPVPPFKAPGDRSGTCPPRPLAGFPCGTGRSVPSSCVALRPKCPRSTTPALSSVGRDPNRRRSVAGPAVAEGKSTP
jgi:hypothetical protein